VDIPVRAQRHHTALRRNPSKGLLPFVGWHDDDIQSQLRSHRRLAFRPERRGHVFDGRRDCQRRIGLQGAKWRLFGYSARRSPFERPERRALLGPRGFRHRRLASFPGGYHVRSGRSFFSRVPSLGNHLLSCPSRSSSCLSTGSVLKAVASSTRRNRSMRLDVSALATAHGCVNEADAPGIRGHFEFTGEIGRSVNWSCPTWRRRFRRRRYATLRVGSRRLNAFNMLINSLFSRRKETSGNLVKRQDWRKR